MAAVASSDPTMAPVQVNEEMVRVGCHRLQARGPEQNGDEQSDTCERSDDAETVRQRILNARLTRGGLPLGEEVDSERDHREYAGRKQR